MDSYKGTTKGKTVRNEWNHFFVEKATKIFNEKRVVIDIGGTLGLDGAKVNRPVKKETAFLIDIIKASGAEYKVLDKVPDYKPDMVGDIHDLPFSDNSVEAIFCCSVLEHVENPIRAVEELYRVLKPGGYLFMYAPFLYHYHPMKGYYGDFWRITYDGWGYLTRSFSSTEISPVFGPIATLANLTPFFYKKAGVFSWIDRLFYKGSRQTSGHNIFCIK